MSFPQRAGQGSRERQWDLYLEHGYLYSKGSVHFSFFVSRRFLRKDPRRLMGCGLKLDSNSRRRERKVVLRTGMRRFPWWSNDWDTTLPLWVCRFSPWLGTKCPYATRQINKWIKYAFHTVHEVLTVQSRDWFAIPSSRDHILSEVCYDHLSKLVMCDMAHNFIELQTLRHDRAVIPGRNSQGKAIALKGVGHNWVWTTINNKNMPL